MQLFSSVSIYLYFSAFLGVGEEQMKIREYFVPHLVEDLKGQGHHEGQSQDQDNGTDHMNGQISTVTDNMDAKTIRNRRKYPRNEKIRANKSSRNLKFTAIYEPTNQSTVRGKWLFMDLMDTKVVILSMFRSLPWYLWLLGILAVISDVIFKTHLVSKVFFLISIFKEPRETFSLGSGFSSF